MVLSSLFLLASFAYAGVDQYRDDYWELHAKVVRELRAKKTAPSDIHADFLEISGAAQKMSATGKICTFGKEIEPKYSDILEKFDQLFDYHQYISKIVEAENLHNDKRAAYYERKLRRLMISEVEARKEIPQVLAEVREAINKVESYCAPKSSQQTEKKPTAQEVMVQANKVAEFVAVSLYRWPL